MPTHLAKSLQNRHAPRANPCRPRPPILNGRRPRLLHPPPPPFMGKTSPHPPFVSPRGCRPLLGASSCPGPATGTSDPLSLPVASSCLTHPSLPPSLPPSFTERAIRPTTRLSHAFSSGLGRLPPSNPPPLSFPSSLHPNHLPDWVHPSFSLPLRHAADLALSFWF